jgi:hypothetical protein
VNNALAKVSKAVALAACTQVLAPNGRDGLHGRR